MRALQLSATIFIIAAAIHISWQKETLSADKDICRLFKDGTKLRKPGFCDQQVTCENFKSVDTLTCTGGQYYNMNTGKCAKSTSDSYCEHPCKASSPKYVNDKKNCEGWYHCSGGEEVKHGLCSPGLHFDQKEQLCMYPSQTKCTATYNLCDVVPTGIPFRDEDNCHKYYQCTKSIISGVKLDTLVCELGKYFDAGVGACTAKAQVDCYKHPYPEEVCGNSKIAYRNRFVSDGATCRGYFYCKDLGLGKPDTAPEWGQCPLESFFDHDLQTCYSRSHVKCDEDRCDGRENGRALSQQRGCRHYLQCANNYTITEVKCDNNYYFDEPSQECVASMRSYPACQ